MAGILDNLVGSVLGGKPLAAIEKVLGTPSSGGVTGFEAGVGSALARPYEAPTTALTDSAQHGPFTEIIVDLKSLGCPIGGPGSIQIVPSTPYLVNLSGYSIHLKKVGVPPGARFLLNVGGSLHLIAPGSTIKASFQNFSIVQRNFPIQSDLTTAFYGIGTGAAGGNFQGEAHFLVAKNPGDIIREADQVLTPPFYRRPSILGDGEALALAGTTNAYGAWSVVGSSGGFGVNAPYNNFLIALCGCRKVRLAIADKPYPQTSGYPVPSNMYTSGDNIQIFFNRVEQNYLNERINVNPGLVMGYNGNNKYCTPSGATFTAPGIGNLDIDMTDADDVMQFSYVNFTHPTSNAFVYIEGFG